MKRALFIFASLCALLAVTVPAVRGENSICDLQLGYIIEGEEVECDAIIVTATFFHGFYAQEPGGCGVPWGNQFSGIFCYMGSLPDGLVEVGDSVYVAGAYEEYFDESELDVTADNGEVFNYGPAVVPIVAEPLTITDVNLGSPTAENWEGVLVNITTANMFSSDTLQAGHWSCPGGSMTKWAAVSTDDPAESLFVRNSVASHEIPVPGSPITFVRGPMSYYRCAPNIIPRDNNDIGYIGPPNVVWTYSTGPSTCHVQFSRNVTAASGENTDNYEFLSGLAITDANLDPSDHSLAILTTGEQLNGALDEIFVEGVQSEGGPTMPLPQSFAFRTGITPIYDIQYVEDPAVNDASPYEGDVVTVIGHATSSNIGTGTSDIYVADDEGPWNGIYVNFTGDQVSRGDKVMVSGQVQEGFQRTEIGWAGYARSKRLGPGYHPMPTTSGLDELKYNDIGISEPYENCLVTIHGAEVDTSTGALQFGETYLVDDAAPADTSKFDYISSGIEDSYVYVPCQGDIIVMTGNVRFSFGQYHIIPRYLADTAVITPGPGCPAPIAVGQVEIPLSMHLKNYPNPFNPTTTIQFDLPMEGQVRLYIVDLSGRVVRTLIEGLRPVGTNQVIWDGMDHDGRPVASGTYFYRVVLGDQEVTERMTLLK